MAANRCIAGLLGTCWLTFASFACAAADLPASPAVIGSAVQRQTVGNVVALPLSFAGNALDRLTDNGRASGVQRPSARSATLPLPLSVSPLDAVTATERNFFGGDRRAWTALRVASSNNQGVLAGDGVAAGQRFIWTWDRTPARRFALPPGYQIQAVVGPADDGSFAADTYNLATDEQEIQQWQANGSRATVYRNVRAKAGMQLFGIASNGIIGAIERDGILLTPQLYDGQWHALSFDYLNCQCDAQRVNARGQILMSPRQDSGANAQGYLVSRNGATLLPSIGPDTRYTDLNDLGDVVGQSGGRPVVILDGVLHELNAYAGSGAPGWQFLTAVAINARRQILGTGTLRGQTRWYRLDLR